MALIICPECENNISSEALSCPHCGRVMKNQNEEIVNNLKSKFNLFFSNQKNKMATYIIGSLFLIAIIGYIVFLFMPEQQARRVADNYLSAMKHGEDTSDYRAFGVSDFYNLLNYEFLKTVDSEVKDSTRNYDEDTYEDWGHEIYDTYSEFRETNKRRYDEDEIIRKDSENLKVITGQYHEFVFLYRIKATNQLGEEIQKRYEIYVNNDNTDDDFEVVRMREK